uniref:MRN complex-interacting protein N-terminal domain-containing protein n=1 Tax=Chromera velia CCMP2878 TaxID=1169474 RepID=A0A0G4HW06_9ALVE|eukprot:Cvel_32469.t1-p1 / transcript=Cvel_32469.t1 / gene=Cvel_32469 / organism=Chromera_velia_CCMP2878 / gene_product=hypothetical protein / transcript_product=hypothetical protein / location=Cvel_scaffold5060:2108-4666(-) / protein_length=403 / sequence_SO=supercontig / SO=protein_coding / is_pseudo=false
MPEFIAVKCAGASCGIFSVTQLTKARQFVCSMCRLKQSVMKVYQSSSSAADLRPLVQEANKRRATTEAIVEQERERERQIQAAAETGTGGREEPLTQQRVQASASAARPTGGRWNSFMEVPPDSSQQTDKGVVTSLEVGGRGAVFVLERPGVVSLGSAPGVPTQQESGFEKDERGQGRFEKRGWGRKGSSEEFEIMSENYGSTQMGERVEAGVSGGSWGAKSGREFGIVGKGKRPFPFPKSDSDSLPLHGHSQSAENKRPRRNEVVQQWGRSRGGKANFDLSFGGEGRSHLVGNRPGDVGSSVYSANNFRGSTVGGVQQRGAQAPAHAQIGQTRGPLRSLQQQQMGADHREERGTAWESGGGRSRSGPRVDVPSRIQSGSQGSSEGGNAGGTSKWASFLCHED